MKRIYNLRVHVPTVGLRIHRPRILTSVSALPVTAGPLPYYPGIRDQGQQGACTAFMGRGLLGTVHNIDKGQSLDFSPRFIYWNERVDDQDTDQDAGSSITQCLNVLCTNGACLESTCPYNDQDYTTPPPGNSFQEARSYLGLEQRQAIQSPEDIQGLLAENNPIGMGIAVYESFESNAVTISGIVPMPNINNEQLQGWHAVCLLKYDQDTGLYHAANSWGTSWGQQGFFDLPFDYVHNPTLCSDLRTLTKAE